MRFPKLIISILGRGHDAKQADQGLEIGGRMNLSLQPGIYELKLTLKNGQSNQTTRQSVFFRRRRLMSEMRPASATSGCELCAFCELCEKSSLNLRISQLSG
jgi:hypothetical protein